MFKNFAKKIAITLNVVLGLQLALLGLGANASGAFAKQIQSVSVSAGFNQEIVTAGQESLFTINVNNVANEDETETLDYENAVFGVFMNTEDGDIEEVTKVSQDMQMDFDTDSIIFGGEAGTPVLSNQKYSQVVKIKFAKPGTYTFMPFFMGDINDEDTALNYFAFEQEVLDVTTLETNLPAVVKNQNETPTDFTVTLNNKYGFDCPAAIGKFTVKNAQASDIKTLEYYETFMDLGWRNLPFEQVGDDLVGYFGPQTGFSVPSGYEATSNYRVSFNTEKEYAVVFELLEKESMTAVAVVEKTVVSDGHVHIKSITSVPSLTNDASKFTKVVVNAGESIEVVGGATLTQGEVEVKEVASVEGAAGMTQTFAIPEGKFTGKDKITFSVKVKDLVGNEKLIEFELVPDVVAPVAVKDISAIVNSDGNVVLTWTNPNKLEDYKTITIYRDEVFLTTVPAGTESFVDSNIEKGKTYSYEIVVGDEAGNTVKSSSVSVSTPAPVAVAAVASDSLVFAAPKTEATPEQSEEVKSETDKNEETKDEKNSLPVWGLVILLALIGVGGYLYFSKDAEVKPIAQTAPKAVTNKPKTKNTTKKKK